MKKLAIVVLLVVAGCRRQAVVTTAPSAQTPAVLGLNVPGGATPREAVTKFMAAAKAQDIQAMSNVWGTNAGPARTDRRFMTVEQMEQRLIYMMRCLRNDSYTIKAETPAPGGERTFAVELRLGNNAATSDFTTTPGPENRFYVRILDLDKLQPICGAK